ncbi:MAG: hypothetical protein WKF57_00060 [Nakamurella sp.]
MLLSIQQHSEFAFQDVPRLVVIVVDVQRRDVLAVSLIAKILGTLPSPAAFGSAPAGRPDGVEWFASATDICRAQVALHAMAGTPSGAPLRAILTMNSGVGDLGVPIGSLAFKGGGDTGVLAGSWLLERKDGGARVLVWTLRGDTAAKMPDTQYFAVAAREALRLLAR